MAECAGRLAGRVGVCAVSSGVAHANALTGVLNAHFDGAPMLLVTGCGPLATRGMGHFQDFDQVALAAPICKYAEAITRPERIPEYVHRAWEAALSGRPVRVHLTFSMDVQTAAVAEGWVAGGRPVRHAQPPAATDLKRAADLLAACERPLVVAGSGAYYAGAEAALAEFTSAFATPVCAPIWDRGAVPGLLDEFVGVVGAASGGPELLADADLLLLLGAAADYRVNYLQGSAGVIRVHADAQRLGELRGVDLEVAADPGLFLTGLTEACIERQMRGFEGLARCSGGETIIAPGYARAGRRLLRSGAGCTRWTLWVCSMRYSTRRMWWSSTGVISASGSTRPWRGSAIRATGSAAAPAARSATASAARWPRDCSFPGAGWCC